MKRGVLIVALGLLLFAAGGPIVEALQPCVQDCAVDAAADDCSADDCCSCCVHVRLSPPDARRYSAALGPVSPLAPLADTQMPAVDPRPIIHVPKLLLG